MEEVEMRRVWTLILCVILILGLVGCQQTEEKHTEMNGDFRYGTWGMTKSEVKALETARFMSETDEGLMYHGEASVYAGAKVVYVFEEGKFTSGSYVVTNNYSDKSLHLDDYNRLKTDLSEQYGEPTSDEHHWKSEAYRKVATEDQLGSMVAKGHLMYFTEWALEEMKVLLFLEGEDGECNLFIAFMPKSKVSEEVRQIPDVTGYQPARSHQAYLDYPSEYEDEFIYITGVIENFEDEKMVMVKDDNGELWNGLILYPFADEEVNTLKVGETITLFGKKMQHVKTEDTVTIFVLKIDQDGCTMHVKNPEGIKMETVHLLGK